MDALARPGRHATRSPWIGFSAVAVGTAMSTLDSSIVNVALPTIGRELGGSIAAVQWIVAAYLLTISAALLTAGRLGDLIGHRRVFVAGMLLFTAGSALCGLAQGLPSLVAARFVQGLGASATMAMARRRSRRSSRASGAAARWARTRARWPWGSRWGRPSAASSCSTSRGAGSSS